MRFRNREEAGRLLAQQLGDHAGEAPVVLALPRGGVPVGFEIAQALGAPLEVLVVRKLGVPWRPELGMGAIAEGGALFLNRDVMAMADIRTEELEAVIAHEGREVERRVRRYRGERRLPELKGRTVLLVDDGLATGGTARAAVRALRELEPRRLVLAVPVSAAETAQALREEVDVLVCLQEPEEMWAIGAWYEDFRQVADEEVLALLEQARHAEGGLPASP